MRGIVLLMEQCGLWTLSVPPEMCVWGARGQACLLWEKVCEEREISQDPSVGGKPFTLDQAA